MDFRTKALEEISTVLAEELSKLIEGEKIKDMQELENGLREMMKGVIKPMGKCWKKKTENLGNECAVNAEQRRNGSRSAGRR